MASMMAPILSVMVAAAIPATAQPDAPAEADFCARLARDSGIDRPPSPDGMSRWTVNAATLGDPLFGGTVITALGVSPVESATVDDYRRLENACRPEGKGAVCDVAGPAVFRFAWKRRAIRTPLASGERATVTTVGPRTTCQTERAPAPRP